MGTDPIKRGITTSRERSKSRFASLTYTGIARSSPTFSPSCQFEPKKICKPKMKTRPRKYSYTKHCKEQSREICDQSKKKPMKPVCVV